MASKILGILLTAGAASAVLLAACGGSSDAQPTAKATPSPSTTGAAAGTAGATATAQAGSQPSPSSQGDSPVQVLNSTHFQNDNGLYFVGELINRGSEDVASVKTTLSLTDANGNEVANGFDGLYALSVLPAGKTMAFKMAMKGAPDSWADEHFQVTSRPATDADRAQVYDKLQVFALSASPATTGIIVQGQVGNIGDKPVKDIQLTFVGRDTDGKVVSAWTYKGNLQPLAPQMGQFFAISVRDEPQVPPKWEIVATGHPG